MPHTDQDALIDRVMALPQPLATKRELLAAIMMDGRVLDAPTIMQGVDDWLAGDPRDAWQKRQNTWEIGPWLELLPFSDEPNRIFERLVKVKAFYGPGHAQRWERVLAAVAAVAGEAGERLLARLAREHRDIASDYDWMRAILRRDTPAAVLLYIDLVLAGVLGDGRDSSGSWHRGREIATFVRKYPELKDALVERYQTVPAGPGRSMLERIFAETGSRADIVAMIAKYAANNRPYDRALSAAVRAVAIDAVPIAEGSSAFNIHPALVGELRRQLFDLITGPAAQAALAKRCLTVIDKLRDEYGIAGNEPRHPDVSSGKPWPEEAKT